MDKNNLQTGKIYNTRIGIVYNNSVKKDNQKSSGCDFAGPSIYIGKILRRDVTNRHIIATEGKLRIEVYAFKEYSFENGKLEIKIARKRCPSLLERKFLSNQFKKALTK